MDSPVRIKDVLRAIAMVHVPIDDQNASETELVDCVTRRDGDVIEEAEPHRRGMQRMVTRWANQAERPAVFSGNHLFDCVDRRPRRFTGDVIRFRTHDGVGLHLSATGGRPFFDLANIRRVVNPADLG